MALVSFILGAVLLQRSKLLPGDLPLGAVGAGFFAKGIFALFHAIRPYDGASVLLYSFAILFGGLALASVWFPAADRFFVRKSRSLLIGLGMCTCFTALLIVYFQDSLAGLVNAEGGFGSGLAVLHYAVGLLYVVGTVWFLWSFIKIHSSESLIFAVVGSLSAVACFSRPFASAWTDEWWYLNLLRLTAFAALLFAVLQDFKKTLVAQIQLQEKLRSLANYPNLNPNPVMRVSADGCVLYANSAARDILKTLKMSGERLLAENFEKPFFAILDESKVFKQEVQCGDEFYLFSFAPIQDEKAVTLYGMDITRRHNAFLSLKKTERRLRQTVTELQRSNQDLEQFAYAASHDLKEPLRMVSNYVQLIERRYRNQLDQDANDFINYAVDGVHRMHALIEGLLEYSRVQTQQHPAEDVDCNRLVQTVLRDMEVQLLDQDAEIICEPLPMIKADRIQMGRVFQNLIGNALKFCDELSPKIEIRGEDRSGHWLFSVQDNGIGIEPEHTEKIFGLFKRLHGREKYSGTGIGLAVCKRIIERHGGKIWVEPADSGSIFKFTVRKEEQDGQGTGN